MMSGNRTMPKFNRGDVVRKIRGSQWHGTIVGTYSTVLTPEGYAVESSTEIGSVQIYPASALEIVKSQQDEEPLRDLFHLYGDGCLENARHQSLEFTSPKNNTQPLYEG